MIRDRNIRQLQGILLMQRLVAYLLVMKYLNRIREITDALSDKTKFTYDANGNLLTVTDAVCKNILECLIDLIMKKPGGRGGIEPPQPWYINPGGPNEPPPG